MGRICAVIGCSNSTKHLDKWLAQLCHIHGLFYGSCICYPPFELFPFPSETHKPERRKNWIKLVNRKNNSGGNWQPKSYDRVCSRHFKEGKPTDVWPDPTEHLGYDLHTCTSASKSPRQPPKERPPYSQVIEAARAKRKKKRDQPPASTSVEEVDITEHADTEDVHADTEDIHAPPSKKAFHALADHDYLPSNEIYVESHASADDSLRDHDYLKASSENDCANCAEKEAHIRKVETKLEELRDKLKQQKRKSKRENTRFDICEIVLKSDETVNQYTGVHSKSKLESLHSFLEPKVKKMRYWKGKKSSPRSTPKGKSKATPQKPGPSRLLNSKQEFILVLLKLRLALTIAFLGSLFRVSTATASHIFNTWIKLLSKELKALIVWPDQIKCRTMIPRSLKTKYRNLRCTIDCTELFIGRPRNLLNQATTWSDYKHHNTVKFLVAIAPNGAISFVSKAWGGRASDVHITREEGFLDMLDPGDVVLADRGFILKEDLLLRHASLHIPPSSKGKEQQTQEEVAKTKKIANARIHVERAIGRMKGFLILRDTLPVTLIPLVDDIIVVCAALVNLRPPLVK